jgi:glycine/sarcosine N-methyltransferase
MAGVREFYDELAGHHHLIFHDWEASITRQASVLGPILERECGPRGSLSVLDCACGIGTQVLGLAAAGFRVTGSDISPAVIYRARSEAAARGLDIPLYVVDMLDLSRIPDRGFDAIICMDNALPHLDPLEQLQLAISEIRAKLRPGGTFMASIRDYDALLVEQPQVQGPWFASDAQGKRITFQLWDWIDDRRYTFHLYITRETATGWQTFHHVSQYRTLLRDELTAVLNSTGFTGVRWVSPPETGFYQPIVLAKAQ